VCSNAQRFDGFSSGSNEPTRLLAIQAGVPLSIDSAFVPLPQPRDMGARNHIKPEALWEHDQAQSTNVMELMRASETRSTLLQQLLALFERVDVLALPTAQVWPFAIGERWPA
jgi:Asp-tRNA(Asn)/Glu-tRNA(Gln) amidotransferase A subunit family amidase